MSNNLRLLVFETRVSRLRTFPRPKRQTATFGRSCFHTSARSSQPQQSFLNNDFPRFYSVAANSKDEQALPTKNNFSFHVSASYSPKNTVFRPAADVYEFDNDLKAQKQRQEAAGQDSWFIANVAGDPAEGVALGVADGVGGYDETGIDSAHFSRALCWRMAGAAISKETTAADPQALIDIGYRKVLQEAKIAGGASTACVGVLKTTGQLLAANLGDSGFIILRQGKVVYSAPPQTHSFNCPLQLAFIPKHVLERARKFGGNPFIDSPRDAALTSHMLKHGDVVLFATDGVWDNLTNQQILRTTSTVMINGGAWEISNKEGILPTSVIKKSMADDKVHVAVAEAVVAAAKSASLNSKVDGPFAKEVQRAFPNENWHGGKKDDICVLCAVVVEEA